MKRINLWLLTLLVILILFVIGLCPLKFAIKIENINYDSQEYIVCKETRITDYSWEKIIRYSDSINDYAIDTSKMETICFNFNKNDPLNYGFRIGLDSVYMTNLFLVYGQKISSELYTCDRWDIIYPIRRNGIISGLLPKSYLCMFDIIGLP